MTSNRRMGSRNSETRTYLLDIAEQLMREEGYAAVTSRQLAKSAGLSPQIVYYYFKTMDDLFEAVFARFAEFYLNALEDAAQASEPLIEIWKLNSNPARALIETEMLALANHRKGLRSLVSQFGREYYVRQTAIIADELQAKGADLERWPPGVVAPVLENIARGFAFGAGFNIGGHIEAQEFVERRLLDLVGEAAVTD